jgi:hypothetical protein
MLGIPEHATFVDMRGTADCWPACLASLLGISIEEFPTLRDADNAHWDEYESSVRALLKSRGYANIIIHNRHDLEWAPRGWSVLVGPAERGQDHAVVGFDGKMVHDPHPSRAGLIRISTYEILIPIVERP